MEGSRIKKTGTVTDKTRLYKYMGLSQFLSLVENRQTFITRIRRWQDTWEAPSYQLPVERDDGQLEYSVWNLSEEMFGQSWSLHSESDAMWRVYSPDREGLVVQTTAGKFDLMDEIRFAVLGPVIYYDNLSDGLAEIKKEDHKDNPFVEAFLKRKAFEYEAEVRLITVNEERCLGMRYKDCDRIYIALDPIEFIESITVDPRSADWYVNTLQTYCARAGLTVVPKKSGLYSEGVFQSTGIRRKFIPVDRDEG
jgi:hypothetical protein